MTRPRFAIFVTFDLRPESVEDFRHRVLQQASDSLRLEAACHQFDVLVDPTKPHEVCLYETYDDEAAFQAHLQTEHYADFSNAVSPWIVSKEVHKLSLVEVTA